MLTTAPNDSKTFEFWWAMLVLNIATHTGIKTINISGQEFWWKNIMHIADCVLMDKALFNLTIKSTFSL